MNIKTYIADRNHKLRNVSNRYTKIGTHKVMSSGNARSYMFTNGDGGPQALLYTSIAFGNGVSQIPDRCCYKFMNLKTVAFNTKSVKSIGKEAFYLCSSLKEISLVDPIEQVGENAFYGCTSLSKVEFPKKTALKLDAQAFNKAGLTSLDISTSSSIGVKAFAECAQLAVASVTGAIGEQMFAGCISLKTISIKGSISSIPSSIFNGCSSLETITFSNMGSIASIGENAFYGCAKLTSFDLGSTRVTSIGASAFARTGIAELEIPSTITSPSQLNPQFLAGSSIDKITFKGISSSYMTAHAEEFRSFGASRPNIKIFSSDGQQFSVSSPGGGGGGSLVSANATVYIVTVSLAHTPGLHALEGMDNDGNDVVRLVNDAYSDDPSLILGTSQLGDRGTKYIMASPSNLDNELNKAAASKADLLIFHFSDHGDNSGGDGFLCMYNDQGTGRYHYKYQDLFTHFLKFKYVFALFLCCKPNSAQPEFVGGGANDTKGLFWCPSKPNQTSYNSLSHTGHEMMVELRKQFNKNYTWDEQFEKIHYKYGCSSLLPVQYNYNNFPAQTSKVFKIEK